MGIDLKDVDADAPRYESHVPGKKGGSEEEKMTLRLRRYGDAVEKMYGFDPGMTVGEAEEFVAKKKGWDNRAVRFFYDGKALSQKAALGEVMRQIGTDAVIDSIPDHKVGAVEGINIPGRIPPNFLQQIYKLIGQTDFKRVYYEVGDLKAKKGYDEWFRVELDSKCISGYVFPQVYIKFLGRWYPFQLILAGYPNHMHGYFSGALPPCPQHGGKHPHVFSDSKMCWGLEGDWKPNMYLYDNVIVFLRRVLERPAHHIGCGR